VKKKLLQYGISMVIGALISLWVMHMEGLFDVVGMSANLIFMILCDAFFVAGILLALFGALVWISTTGFFDTFGYAIRSAAHLLLPFINHDTKTFYDYKTEKAEKRGESKGFLVIVGGFYLLLSAVFLVLWMVG
jgi:hypothetical protein